MTEERTEHSFRVTAWWTSGRTGIAKAESAPNAIHFTAPVEFGGLEGRWTAEELLLAALAACFTNAFRAVADSAQAEFANLEVEVFARLNGMRSGYSFTEITIRPTLKIAEYEERERALDLLKKAERTCLVLRTLNTPVKFEPQLEVIQPSVPV